ncbi:non-ribosomal peptide synthetase [Cytobacillus purgationiresistens]|nr:non-ribosomal peptide synthetase [Cytobacillus purgationiresistens]
MTQTLYPLTNAQKRVWFIEKIYPNSGLMNLAGSVRFASKVDPALLSRAIQQFIEENESIENQVVQDIQQEEGVYQKLQAKDIPHDIPFLDFSGMSEPEKMAEAWIVETTSLPFQFNNSPLFQFAILQISETEIWLYLKTHHIISDGVSLHYTCNEIADLYLNLVRGELREISKKPLYTDMIEKEKRYIASKRYKSDKEYWLKNFENIPDSIFLKRSGVHKNTIESSRYEISLDRKLRDNIDQFCLENDVTPAAFFNACLYAYLYRISGKKDITLGQVTRNRTGIKEKSTFGMFVNIVPLRCKISPSDSFKDTCRHFSDKQRQMLRHQRFPYNHILSGLREKLHSVPQLFNISVEFQVLDFQRHKNLPYVIETHPCGSLEQEMVVHIKDRSDLGTYRVEFEYQSFLFNEGEINAWANRYMELIKDALAHPEQLIKELNLLPEPEAKQIIVDWNQTERDYRLDRTFVDLFHQQVKTSPHSVALEYKEVKLTYQELDKLSGRLATRLRYKGIGTESVVAIMLPRGLDLIVSIIGIQKAGGAYLAIDPNYPLERVTYMLKDSQSDILLTSAPFKERMSAFKGQIADIKGFQLNNDSLFMKAEKQYHRFPKPEHLAYLIYTSGSTGRPKGVMVEQRALSNLIYNTLDELNLNEKSRVLQNASCSFDTSVFEILPTFCSGGTLILESRDSLLPGKPLVDVIKEKEINMLTLTPSVLMKLSSYGDGKLNEKLPHLKTIKSAGEACPLEIAVYWSKNRRFVNGYGPAECAVWSTTGDFRGGENVDIGRPLNNITAFILDENQKVVPPGVNGEIYLGGASLARGYRNLPDLTDKAYVIVDFNREDAGKKRLYKTGDRARFLPDGRIEYLGRNDSQVKVRGQRVELSEIENVLEQHPLVKQAVAVSKDDEKSGKKIAAFIIPKSSTKTSASELRMYLQDRLPSFMVPGQFKFMTEMPISPHGKVDRQKLQYENIEMEEASCRNKPPVSKLEQTLTSIWSEALGIKAVGTEENFFDLGGDSFTLLWVHQKAQDMVDSSLTVMDMFRYPTIRSYAEHITLDKQQREEVSVKEQKEVTQLREKQRNRQKSLRKQWRVQK